MYGALVPPHEAQSRQASQPGERYNDMTLTQLTSRLISPAAGGTYTWKIGEDRVFCDPLVADLFGIPQAQALLGQPIARFLQAIHPDDLERVSAAINAQVETGRDYRESYRVISATGVVSKVLAMGRCFRDSDGKPFEYAGMLFNLSDPRGAQPNDEIIAGCSAAFRAAQNIGNEFVAYLLSMVLIELGHQAARELQPVGAVN